MVTGSLCQAQMEQILNASAAEITDKPYLFVTVKHCLKNSPKYHPEQSEGYVFKFLKQKSHIISFVVTQDYSNLEYAE